jgi:hypothetical protein
VKRFDWHAALAEAVNNVRMSARGGDWYSGYMAGASAVHVEMMRLEREHAVRPVTDPPTERT